MTRRERPSWRALHELAVGQGGYFRLRQAAEIGFSAQNLRAHVLSGKLQRTRRGVYRIAGVPISEQDDLLELWVWSEEEGVFSHDTALSLHELSDVLPARIHMTVPLSWKSRARRQVPRILILHYADLPAEDRTWVGSVPVTTPSRTLRDVIDDKIDPAFVQQAVREGIERGLFDRRDLRGIVAPRRGRPRSPRPTTRR